LVFFRSRSAGFRLDREKGQFILSHSPSLSSLTLQPDSHIQRFPPHALLLLQLLSPISSTSPTSTIRCIGLNYADHAQECGLPYPPTPVLFLKPSACIAGPNSTVPIPAIAQDGSLDWEVELAVVIGEGPEGRACKDVGEEEAMGFVLGFATANDVRCLSLPSFLLCPPFFLEIGQKTQSSFTLPSPPSYLALVPLPAIRLFPMVLRQIL
jgi:hypothetical protein